MRGAVVLKLDRRVEHEGCLLNLLCYSHCI
jgi:hypothetical protein